VKSHSVWYWYAEGVAARVEFKTGKLLLFAVARLALGLTLSYAVGTGGTAARA
jgi:hypothetical protein